MLNKKKFIGIGVVAILLAAAPMYSSWFSSLDLKSELADLTGANIVAPDFDDLVKCDYQDEIDSSFASLNTESANYDVLYNSYSKKYSDEEYSDCEIPEAIRQVKPTEQILEEKIEAIEPVAEVIEGSGSELVYAGSTYYERAYNYVPEIPTPVFEFPAPN